MSMMCRPKWPFLHMCVFHDVRHVEFRGLTGSQRTPRVWGVTYPIPNKKDLIQRIYNATIFSKFDMKSGFWQIQIEPKDRYKTAFTVLYGHYEWNVMPFGLKQMLLLNFKI